jgi:hypothetical protein
MMKFQTRHVQTMHACLSYSLVHHAERHTFRRAQLQQLREVQRLCEAWQSGISSLLLFGSRLTEAY